MMENTFEARALAESVGGSAIGSVVALSHGDMLVVALALFSVASTLGLLLYIRSVKRDYDLVRARERKPRN